MTKKRWNFTAEIPVEIIVQAQVRGASSPAVPYLRNGDPGHPAEFDEEREVTGAYIDLAVGWDYTERFRPRRLLRRLALTPEQVEALRGTLQVVVNQEELNPADYEQEPPEFEERCDCPIHGLQKTAECPRC